MTIDSDRGTEHANDFIRALPANDSVSRAEPMLPAREERPVILLELTDRAGVWEVTRDGAICGRYLAHQQAFEAIEAAAHKVISEGGRADIMLRSPR